MNGPGGVDWIPALGVLGVGLGFGALLVWRLVAASRAVRAATTVPVQVRDLAGKRDVLVRQLQELEDTASKRTPEQLARERYTLELEAARVMLELEGSAVSADAKKGRSGAGRTSRRAAAAPSRRAGLRGFLWGTGSASALLLLAFFVYQSAKPRESGASLTGDLPSTGRSAGAGEAADGDEKEIKAALAKNPDDVDAHLALAHLDLARRDMMGVWNETKRVLELSPGNPKALAYQALVRLAMGQAAMAVDLLKKAVASDPNLVDGYVYLALGYTRLGRTRDAEATIAEASRRFPDRTADFRRLLGELKTQEPAVAAAEATPEEANPHAGLAAPGDGTRPAAAVSPGRRVAGTVDLDPALKGTVAPGAVLFVFVRQAGVPEGPPLAAKRLPPIFPAFFELSQADAMMGQPFPDPLLIEARLDSDGDPTTRPPTDPKARLDGVKAGRTDLRLVLKRQ